MKQGLGTKHAALTDHSGLKDTSRISASDMVRALVKVGHEGVLPAMMKEIVPLDRNGRAEESAARTIRAKTGSLNFVSTLAGYLTAPTGRQLAFAIFTGDMERRAAIPRADRERPAGARDWAARSRWLQHRLLDRWSIMFDA